MIPYGQHSIDETDLAAVLETLKSNLITQGPKVQAFEQAIAQKVQSKYAVATSSATAALHITCLSMGLSSKDIAWTVPLTFVASANAIKYCGAQVDFVDINLSNGCICIQSLEDKLLMAQQTNTLPKILIVVHYSGISCDMEAIAQLCKPYNIKIIEDASHAIGATYKNKPVGSCSYSEATVFSFHPVKIITSGEGGMVTTNDESLCKKLRLYASHGITKEANKLAANSPPWYYEQQLLGFNYRMSDIHAALGLSQLSKLDIFIQARTQQANHYKESLKNLPIRFLQVPENTESAWHLFVIQLNDDSPLNRECLYNKLHSHNIGCQIHYIPVYLQPYYEEEGFKKGDFPIAEKFYSSCLSLPIFPSLKEQNFVIDTLLKLFKE